jgi:hypothetical protein
MKLHQYEKTMDLNVPERLVTLKRWDEQRELNERLCLKLGNIVSRLKTRFDPDSHRK